jgi:hypothetical protein
MHDRPDAQVRLGGISLNAPVRMQLQMEATVRFNRGGASDTSNAG